MQILWLPGVGCGCVSQFGELFLETLGDKILLIELVVLFAHLTAELTLHLLHRLFIRFPHIVNYGCHFSVILRELIDNPLLPGGVVGQFVKAVTEVPEVRREEGSGGVEGVELLKIMCKVLPHVPDLLDLVVQQVQRQMSLQFHTNDHNINMIANINGTAGYKQNIEAVTLQVFDTYFLIDPSSQLTNIKTTLRVDKATLTITEQPKLDTPDSTNIPITVKKYSGFLGVLPVLSESFLVFINEISFACSIQKHDVFEVATVSFLERDKGTEQKQEERKSIWAYLNYMKDVIFRQGFYFSYTYDLTLSKIRYAEGYPQNLNYCWNCHLSKPLLQLKDQSWVLPMIQGYVKTFSTFIQGKKLQYFLIMRRSWKKGGTRYNSRGVDEKGFVANFCESEQLVIYNDYLCSHVQVRGSVPLFWKQSGITAKIEFYREHEPTKTAFKRHFEQLKEQYSNVLCCNLLAKKKTGEQALTQYYETLIKEFNLPWVRYEYFDFHLITKKQRFERANYLLDKLQQLNDSFKYYLEDTRHSKVIQTQKGVIRTNCADCLDRTNFVQTKIAIQIFESMLKHLGLNTYEALGYESLVSALDKKTMTSEKLIVNFKNIWADGGDTISCLYTGTGSTHTNVTRTGERDFVGIIDHGMKTLGRFYQQNVEDWYKQEVIDLMLGEHTNTINIAEFESKMKEMQGANRKLDP